MTSKPEATHVPEAPPAATGSHVDSMAAPPTYEQAIGAAAYPPMPPLQLPPLQQPPPPIGFHPIVHQPPVATHNPMQPSQQPPIHMIRNTILVQQSTVGPHSTNITCPHCLKAIRTFVSYDAAARTHLFALILCLFCAPCCFLPYFITACKDTNHYCPSCGNFLGTYNFERY